MMKEMIDVDGIAENESMHKLTCTRCRREIARKRIHALENLADKEGWQIADNRQPTICPQCLAADEGTAAGGA